MKKRVLSFLLCLLMVLPLMLVSCDLGGDDPDVTTGPDDEGTVYVKPATLNFHIIADKTVSPDDEAAIEASFNEISKKLYKTQVDFIFYTADEYDEKIMDVLGDANAIGGISASNKFENSEVVTSLNNVDIPIELYPDIENNQVDIILVNSKELYQSLRGKRYLTEISELLKTKFTDIEQRVNSHLINGAKENKNMYAVPNNVLIGQYEFVLIHERMAYLTSYLQKEDFLTGKGSQKTLNYSKLREFATTLQGIKEATSGEDAELYGRIKTELGVSNIFPMEASFEYPTVAFFPKAETVDIGDGKTATEYRDTVFGVVYPFNATKGSYIKLDNVFDDANYVEHKKLMLEATENGYYPTAAATDAAYGIRYATGNFVDIEKYEKAGYIVIEVDTPRLNSDAAFNAMFAVTNYSASTERSLEIIQALVAGTDEDEVELRNILQYGVEGKHYTKDKDTNNVTRNSNYMMNANYTGNLVTAYPCEEDGRGQAFIGYFTEQNKDATLNPLYGMTTDILWKNCHTSMVDFYLCEEMLASMLTEFADVDDTIINTMMKDTADPDDTVDDKRADLLKGARDAAVKSYYPAADFKEAYKRLYQYWLDVRSGINPLAEKTDATPSAPADVKSALDKQITDIETVAKAAATEYLANAADKAATLWADASQCTTVAEFEVFLARLAAIKNGKNSDNSELSADDLEIYTLLYLSKAKAEETNADFYGLLYSGGSGSLVYPSTLTDALAAWYYDYVNGR